MDAPEKKARCPNLSREERLTLVDLVLKHSDVIENKKTDNTTQQLKVQVWKTLTQEFNCLCTYYYRSPENLRTAWENLKKLCRRSFTTDKIPLHILKQRRTDPLLVKVMELINPPSAEKYKNQYMDLDPSILKYNHQPSSSKSSIGDPEVPSNEEAEVPPNEEAEVPSNEEPEVPSIFRLNNSSLEDEQTISEATPILYEELRLADAGSAVIIEEGNSVDAPQVEDYECVNARSSRETSTKYKSHPWRRRKPFVRRDNVELVQFYKAKLEAVELEKQHIIEQHNMLKEWHEIRMLREKEGLRQDKLRTQLLMKELLDE